MKRAAIIAFSLCWGALSFATANETPFAGSEKQMRTFKLKLLADYHQFHLHDGEKISEDLGSAWTKEAVIQMIATTKTTVAVGTATTLEVPVEIVIAETAPDEPLDLWDHVMEAGLNITTGTLVVAGCVDYLPDSLHIPISPGSYRVRVSIGGLATVKHEFEGGDYYKVALWPAPMTPVRMLKNSGFNKSFGAP